MNNNALLLLAVACVCKTNGALAQPAVPVVNTSIGANAAAQALVGSNVTVSNAIFSGDARQLAAFSNGMNTVGFANGILLTTCDAAFAGAMNDGTVEGSPSYGLNTGLSDPDLDILNGPGTARDAAVLEFDFVTSDTDIEFNFVFASKEHNGWALSGFNDAFGFFISGPGISGLYSNGAENIALINGVPATVNNVNAGVNSNYIVTQGFPGVGVQNLSDPSTWWFAWERWTIPVAGSIGVQCNATYHAKIAICNTSDNLFHSGVFLRSGTLNSPYSPPGPLTIAPSPVCAGEEITLTVQGDPTWTYTWSTGQSGVGLQSVSATAGLDQNSYSVSAEYLPGCSLTTSNQSIFLTVHDPENIPPQCMGVNGTGVYYTTMQVGQQTCFTIPTIDTPNEPVQISQIGAFGSGSFSSNNAFQQTGTFCWTPNISDLGFHTLEMLITDENVCEQLTTSCSVQIKVVCNFCPIRVYYENRAPDWYPLPELTLAGESITAGFSVDSSQEPDGNVITGDAAVEFRAPYIDLQPGFFAGPGFIAVPDPDTCIEDCDVCCDGWGGFTVDTYGVGTHNVLYNVMSPNGDGVNDRWEVDDTDHPYCAYGALAYRLEFFSQWGLVYRKEEFWSGECCPFRSWSPSNPVVSSIHWDGTANVGAAFCQGCPVPSSVYNYILTLTGCNGQITYTGNVQLLDSQAGLISAPIPPMEETLASLVADSLVTNLPAEPIPGAVVTTIEASGQQPVLHLLPNPATDHVWLEYAPGLAHVWVLDATGRRVMELAPQGVPTVTLHVGSLAAASYILIAVDTEGQIHNRKLIKQ